MIRIVSDTTCSLPQEVIDEYGIILIPVHLTIDGLTVRDRFDMPAAMFYEQLARSGDAPQTTQPSVEEFKTLYRGILMDNPKATVFSIHMSSALSGTIASAEMAADSLPSADIRVIDTHSLGAGHGLMVLRAAKVARETGDPVQVMQALASARKSMGGYLVLDTLHYLAQSGRLGRAARLLGGLLHVKPVLTLTNGSIETYQRCRSRVEALNALSDLSMSRGAGKMRHLGIMHTACGEEAEVLAARLREELEPDTVIISELSGAIGAFLGPRALGVSWCEAA